MLLWKKTQFNKEAINFDIIQDVFFDEDEEEEGEEEGTYWERINEI